MFFGRRLGSLGVNSFEFGSPQNGSLWGARAFKRYVSVCVFIVGHMLLLYAFAAKRCLGTPSQSRDPEAFTILRMSQHGAPE